MTITEILELPPHILREVTHNLIMEYDGARCMRFGAALWRIKNESLYKEWGHKTFYQFCRNEIKLKPANSENWRISAYVKLRAIGLTDEDMAVVENRRMKESGQLTNLWKICQTREQVLANLDPDKNKDLKRLAQTLKHGAKMIETIDFYGYGRAQVGPFFYHPADYDIVHETFAQMFRNFSLNQDRCLLAFSLIFKILRETTPDQRYAEMKKQCLFHSLPQEFADFVFGDEAWRGMQLMNQKKEN